MCFLFSCSADYVSVLPENLRLSGALPIHAGAREDCRCRGFTCCRVSSAFSIISAVRAALEPVFSAWSSVTDAVPLLRSQRRCRTLRGTRRRCSSRSTPRRSAPRKRPVVPPRTRGRSGRSLARISIRAKGPRSRNDCSGSYILYLERFGDLARDDAQLHPANRPGRQATCRPASLTLSNALAGSTVSDSSTSPFVYGAVSSRCSRMIRNAEPRSVQHMRTRQRLRACVKTEVGTDAATEANWGAVQCAGI